MPKKTPLAADGFSLWGAAAFLCAFALSAVYVLHDFYQLGAMRDTYWFAGVVWRSGWQLKDPAAASFIPDGSFLRTHLSPLLYVPNALSYVFSLAPTYWYAIVYGLLHASLTLGVFHWVRRLLGLSVAASIAAALLALMFAFNGNAVVSLQLPHYEVAIPAFALVTLSLLAAERYGLALLALTVMLTLREDAGLHFAALLAPTLIVRRMLGRQGWRMDRWALRFAVGAIFYSVLAFMVQRWLYGSNGMLEQNYLGSPPYAHVNKALVYERLSIYLHERSYIWIPFLASILWAVLARNPLIPLGFIGGLPWLLLHFFAKGPVVGGMAWYYGFPLLAGLAWPLLAAWWWRDGAPSARERHQVVAGFALMLACTMVGQVAGRVVVYPEMLLRPSTQLRAEAGATDRFMAALLAQPGLFGQLRIDEGVRGLAPHAFAASSWLSASSATAAAIDTIIWFDPGAMDNEAWLLSMQHGLEFHYAIPGTHLVMTSNRNLEALAPLASFIEPTSLLLRRLEPGMNSQLTKEGIHVPATAGSGVFASGPRRDRATGLYVTARDLYLPPGRYQFAFEFRMQLPPTAPSNSPMLGVDIGGGPEKGGVRTVFRRDQLKVLPNGRYVAQCALDVRAMSRRRTPFVITLERYMNADLTLSDARLTIFPGHHDTRQLQTSAGPSPDGGSMDSPIHGL